MGDGTPEPTSVRPTQTSNRADSGRLIVDEIAAERALERTLVQAGALLLPRGAFEFRYFFSSQVSTEDGVG